MMDGVEYVWKIDYLDISMIMLLDVLEDINRIIRVLLVIWEDECWYYVFMVEVRSYSLEVKLVVLIMFGEDWECFKGYGNCYIWWFEING